MKLTILALNILAASAFTSAPLTFTRTAPLRMSTEIDTPITVTGNNIDLTPALVDYITKKLERPLGKLCSNGIIKDCTVHLIVNKNPKVRFNIELLTDLHIQNINSKDLGLLGVLIFARHHSRIPMSLRRFYGRCQLSCSVSLLATGVLFTVTVVLKIPTVPDTTGLTQSLLSLFPNFLFIGQEWPSR